MFCTDEARLIISSRPALTHIIVRIDASNPPRDLPPQSTVRGSESLDFLNMKLDVCT